MSTHSPLAANRRPRLRRSLTMISTVMMAAVISGCGLLGGNDAPERSDSSGANGEPEVNRLDITILDTLETAPLHYALAQGYFRDEGLEIKLDKGKSGSDNTSKMINGRTNIAFSSYSPFFLAQSEGMADIKLIADASATALGNATIMARPNSNVGNIRDLAGKRVGVSQLGTMAHLLTESVAKVAGVDTATIEWIPMPFPQTADALIRGDIDAAYLTEPFHQEALTRGLDDISDTSIGPTDGIPLTGYAALAKFVEQNPNAVAAFQRVMVRAALELTASDYSLRQSIVEKILPELPDNLVELVRWPELTWALDPTRIQRTADLMDEFDEIPYLDVEPMIVRPKLPE